MANAQLKKVLSESRNKEKDSGSTEIRIPDSYVEKMTAEDMIREFPKLVRGGQVVKALEIVQGHGRFNWFFWLLDKGTRYLFCRQKKEKPATERENDAVLPVLKEAKAE